MEEWEPTEEELEILSKRYGLQGDELHEVIKKTNDAIKTRMAADKDREQERYRQYGVDHECTCTEDILAGNLDVVPHCTVRLVSDLFHGLEAVNKERDDLRAQVDELEAVIEEMEAEHDV